MIIFLFFFPFEGGEKCVEAVVLRRGETVLYIYRRRPPQKERKREEEVKKRRRRRREREQTDIDANWCGVAAASACEEARCWQPTDVKEEEEEKLVPSWHPANLFRTRPSYSSSSSLSLWCCYSIILLFRIFLLFSSSFFVCWPNERKKKKKKMIRCQRTTNDARAKKIISCRWPCGLLGEWVWAVPCRGVCALVNPQPKTWSGKQQTNSN